MGIRISPLAWIKWYKSEYKWTCVLCVDKKTFKTFKEFQIHFIQHHSMLKYLNK